MAFVAATFVQRVLAEVLLRVVETVDDVVDHHSYLLLLR